MSATDKHRIVTRMLAQRTKFVDDRLPEQLTVLDHLLLAVLQEGTTWAQGLAAYEKLRAGFHDFNEMRVSHPQELEAMLDGIPAKQSKSGRILRILQFVFETTYVYDLESMKRKPLKQAQKQLSKITGANDFAVAATVQRALGGHALPLDGNMRRVLARVKLVSADAEDEQARGTLEHLVPKSEGVSFCLLLSELGVDSAKQARFVDAVLPKTRRNSARVAGRAKPESKMPARGYRPPQRAGQATTSPGVATGGLPADHAAGNGTGLDKSVRLRRTTRPVSLKRDVKGKS